MGEATGARPGVRPKPTALKVLHGDFKINPQRRRKDEPVMRGEVVRPDLTPAAGQVWDYLAPMLTSSGVLTPPDQVMFAEFCEATVVVRLARLAVMRVATGQQDIAPGAASPFTSYLRAVNVMTNLGGRFGLSPSDRTRLSVPQEQRADDLISG